MTAGSPDEPIGEEAPQSGAPPGADLGDSTAQAGTDPGPESAQDADAGATPSPEQQLAERTADLQRLQAEFLNYKRRVDRDRDLVRQNAVFTVLTPMLDVLDSIDRAREHGELEGGFKGVAEQFERIVSGLGLIRFGDPGDAFDPALHEALSHIGADPEVPVVTCKQVVKSGYKIGDRVVRAAQVLVVDPAEPAEPSGPADDPS